MFEKNKISDFSLEDLELLLSRLKKNENLLLCYKEIEIIKFKCEKRCSILCYNPPELKVYLIENKE